MSETRLVAMTDEQALRLSVVLQHPDNDLSPNDEAGLRSLWLAYQDGITAEEARALEDFERGEPEAEPAYRKLRSALASESPGQE